jgi:hypothetical protein
MKSRDDYYRYDRITRMLLERAQRPRTSAAMGRILIARCHRIYWAFVDKHPVRLWKRSPNSGDAP